LNVFTIFLPPLRARKSDILLLAEHFLEKYEIEHSKRIKRISTPAIDMLTSYHFPGNVRELENVIERAVIVCDSNVIHGYHLPPTLQTAEVTDTVTEVSLASAVENYEKNLIQDSLKSTRGNILKAARLLNSTERILGYKIKKYKIDTIRFKV
jgi:Nif-specific regulatory protein